MEESAKTSDRILLTKLTHLSRMIVFASLPLALQVAYDMYWRRFLEFQRDWNMYYPELSAIPYPLLLVVPAVIAVIIELVFVRKIWLNVGTAFIWTLGLITFETGLILLSPFFFIGNSVVPLLTGFILLSCIEVALIFSTGFRADVDVKRRYSGPRSSSDATIVTIIVTLKTVVLTYITINSLLYIYHWMGIIIINEYALVLVSVDILALLAIMSKRPWAYEALIISVSNSYLAISISVLTIATFFVPLLGCIAAFVLFRRGTAVTSIISSNLV